MQSITTTFVPTVIPIAQAPGLQQGTQSIVAQPIAPVAPFMPLGAVAPVNPVQDPYTQPVSHFTNFTPSPIINISSGIPETNYIPGSIIDEDDEVENENPDGKRLKKKDEVPMQVDKFYNMDSVMAEGILKSDYFKDL